MKQTAVEWLMSNMPNIGEYIPLGVTLEFQAKIEQAKAIEKEQMKDAFVECWKSNVPDGVQCKLDAEQYYNETFK